MSVRSSRHGCADRSQRVARQRRCPIGVELPDAARVDPESASPDRDSERHPEGEDAMKALVYHGPGEKSWTDVPEPQIQKPTDVVVRIDTTTICGTDLHI